MPIINRLTHTDPINVTGQTPVNTVGPPKTGDWIDSDPAIGVPCYEPVEALARARRAGINCHGGRTWGASQLAEKQAQGAFLFAGGQFSPDRVTLGPHLAVAFDGCEPALMEYQWYMGGYSISPFAIGAQPSNWRGATLQAFLDGQHTAASNQGVSLDHRRTTEQFNEGPRVGRP